MWNGTPKRAFGEMEVFFRRAGADLEQSVTLPYTFLTLLTERAWRSILLKSPEAGEGWEER